jgi:hypothetical protein
MGATAVLLLGLLATAPADAGKPALPSLFPAIEGWKMGTPAPYTPEGLFEYIDGGADAFLQYDFQELLAASYVNARKVEISVDIYRHRDAIRAFGMYTQERRPGSTLIPVGVEGNSGSDHLEFVKGPYYVKLVQAGGKETSFLRLFADKVAAQLPGSKEPPPVLRCFPNQGKRPRAEKLIARDFLGYAFLHDAAVVPYEIEGAQFRLFALAGKDAADLHTMIQRYLAAAKMPAAEIKNEGTATLKDPLNGEVLLQWSGHWLWGAVDQPSPARKALVEELGRRLLEKR